MLSLHFRERGSPCSVVVSPGVVPRVQAGYNVRIPDLAVTCSPYTDEEPLPTDPVLLGRGSLAQHPA